MRTDRRRGSTGTEATGTEATSTAATEKSDGVGGEGTIPADDEGIAAGLSAQNSNFNPEEDPEEAATDAIDD